MWLRTGCNITFEVDIPTPFILMLRPRSGLQQWVSRDSYILTPSVPVIEFTDNYGNLCQRLIAPVGEFSVVTSADILTTENIDVDFAASFEEVQNLPNSVLTYLLPSRYCQSDQFVELAQEIVVDVMPGYSQVAAIMAWVQNNIRFNSESSHFQLSAIEVNQQKEGVCRDLAHLCIALCRALCIPARIVAGYLHELEPMDFHAWFEAYVGGRWYTFDPTQAQPKGGRVALAYGRDAVDVAIFNQFGPLLSPQNMLVSVEYFCVAKK
jgi:transglutaminase-like putative cysteine protease